MIIPVSLVCWRVLAIRTPTSTTPRVHTHNSHIFPINTRLFNGYKPGGRLNIKMWLYQYRDPHVKDYENPLHLDVVDRYLGRMGDKTIPDEAPPSLESFCLVHPGVRDKRRVSEIDLSHPRHETAFW